MAVLGAVAAILVAVPTASAGNTPCVGALPPGTYDNVVVPKNEQCMLNSSLVLGNVKALRDSILFADSNEIRGNVEGDKADVVSIVDTPDLPEASIVHGNIKAKEGGGSTGASSMFNTIARVCGTLLPQGNIQIEKFSPGPANPSFVAIGAEFFCDDQGGGNTLQDGNIKVEENTITGLLRVDLNQVGGNLQVSKNTGDGPKTVNGNTGSGNLKCFNNSPPFDGSGNTFPKEEGQCN